jgi:uncharacterized LabA/DUF88 family protein
VSKNVAVFVDVANIFYAAKAAGVDIDYVTLLKTATAGRDFVRAYAYTGLDPENENQRQFHGFLARSGYKVVSKDIRKYGDGKVKANLDIELVVDMMRTAQNLDIAVVVSGDGDFAPAIRAVQQMGVRVEVVSFRGNTSSDLIDVADTFIDITQIAKVEKDSARSGRRVAAEGDLSMTEVPDKESEGAPRRGRGRGRGRPAEREEAVETGRRTATGTELVVLPGEKLSKVVPAVPAPAEEEHEGEPVVPAAEGGEFETGLDAEGRPRRRRRRGGRGRGRGRGPERETLPAGPPAEEEEEEEAPEYEAPRVPQHSAFGSVWDSQLGVTPAPVVASGAGAEEEYEDEPEIPEYLLAERRQRAGRPGGGGPVRGGMRGGMRGGVRGGRGGSYQAAVDRERYGRGGGGAFTGPAPTRQPAVPRRERGGRPDRGPRPGREPAFEAPVASEGGEPWSEVPPELEQMLRAELARKGSRPATAAVPAAEAPAAPKRRVTRKPATAAVPAAAVPAAEAPAAPKQRATRKPATPATTAAATPAPAVESDAKPKRRTTRKTTATEA